VFYGSGRYDIEKCGEYSSPLRDLQCSKAIKPYTQTAFVSSFSCMIVASVAVLFAIMGSS
jgi:hypothetical protein